MSKVLRDNKLFIAVFDKLTSAQQKALLKLASKHQVRALREIALNVLHGTVPLTGKQKKSLKKIKRFLVRLATKRPSKQYLVTAAKAIAILLCVIRPFLETL